MAELVLAHGCILMGLLLQDLLAGLVDPVGPVVVVARLLCRLVGALGMDHLLVVPAALLAAVPEALETQSSPMCQPRLLPW